MSAPIVIIGAGQAGLQLAESLRSEGYTGPLVMIGDEEKPPYHRPPLSKAVLAGEMDEAQIEIRGAAFLARKEIEWRGATKVQAIDRAARTVTLGDGAVLTYDRLALATGSRPRPLLVPGGAGPGIFTLRTIADTRALAAILPSVQRLVVIGGGFIGLEAAAVARKRGITVTLLEAADRLMGRAVAPILSQLYFDLHRSHGVEIELGAQVTGIDAGTVVTADGRRWPADAVLVGIGAIANDDLAVAAGLACDRGIIVDACGRTSDPLIVAAGDCTLVRRGDGSLGRLESVQNAVEQAKAAAAALMGKDKPFTAAPWFWSDQYGIKLQMVGSWHGADQTILRGDAAAADLSIFHFRAGHLIGLDTLNRPQDHMAGRKLIDRQIALTPEQAADPAVDLLSLL